MAENSITKFKVGDKVKVLSAVYACVNCEFIGDVGIIVECNNNWRQPYKVLFAELDTRGHDIWWFTAEDLELIENTPDNSPVTPHADPVNHPSHYNQGSIECIDAIEAATNGLDGFEGHCTGTSMKYIWRWKFKNGTEDIKKSIWYLQKLLKYEEAKENK